MPGKPYNNDDLPRFDDVPDMSIDAFERHDVADTLTDIHETVGEAVEAAVAHTLIDRAGHEAFVDRVEAEMFRDAVRRLQDSGYGFDPERSAFYAGEYAFDQAKDVLVTRAGDKVVDTDLHVDGIPIHDAPAAPAAVAIVADFDALAKIPPALIARRFRNDDTATISSPVTVRDPNGVVVMNISEDGGDE